MAHGSPILHICRSCNQYIYNPRFSPAPICKCGKKAEQILGKADITVNKNMVPFDDKSPFVTSGIRVGTPAITTRGLVESDMETVVDLIDRVLTNHTNEEVIEQVANEVNEMMSERAMFVY